MKSFTTPEYISPIIEEIGAAYTPVYDTATLAALDCAVLLKKNRTREYIAVRTTDKCFYYYSSSKAMHALFKELADWTEAAETYTGELDRWMYNEECRIMEAVRVALIEEYGTNRDKAIRTA